MKLTKKQAATLVRLLERDQVADLLSDHSGQIVSAHPWGWKYTEPRGFVYKLVIKDGPTKTALISLTDDGEYAARILDDE